MTVKSLFAALMLVAASAHAATLLPDACGKNDVNFNVRTTKNRPVPTSSPANEGQIIFMETVYKNSDNGGSATIRLGLDGAWAGAIKGNSYFVVYVSGGEHHLCAAWQSHFQYLRDHTYATSITVKPGQTYFVDYDITLTGGRAVVPVTNFAIINSDQGQFYLKTYPVATWTTGRSRHTSRSRYTSQSR